MNLRDRIQSRVSGKALIDQHPEMTEREHLFSIRSDMQAAAPYTYLSAIVTYETYVWVQKAIKVISDAVASLPVYCTRGKERLEQHEVVNLLTDVNDAMSSGDLWRQWTIDQLLGGEVGFELVRSGRGQYTEIWPRQPNIFNVYPNPARRRYLEVAKYEIDDKQGEPYFLPPDEFIHFKFYNPRNPWRGLPVLIALQLAIAVDVFAQSWEKYLYQNNARPEYAIVTPQGTTQRERDDIEKKITLKYGGSRNVGKPIVLEESITDIKILSWKPKDLSGIPLRQMSRDEVAGGFGVPDILMGFGNDSYDTSEKRSAAVEALYTLTIKPLLAYRDTHLTEFFQRNNAMRDDEFLHTDYSGVTELGEEENDEWKRDREKIDRGVLTVNDWLTARGQKPKPWGDVAWMSKTLMPISGPEVPVAALPKPAPQINPNPAPVAAPAATPAKQNGHGTLETISA